MPLSRRMIFPEKTYELCIRTKKGLPFPCRQIIDLLLKSAIARTQRDSKISICHFVWMGNHLHLILRTISRVKCVRFYEELQKKITDYLKRLYGVKELSIWEGRATLMEILDIEKVVERIAYIYLNPVKANCAVEIQKYPGLSSWKTFQNSLNSLEYENSENCPWVRQFHIETLPSFNLTERQDKFIANKIKEKAKEFHSLVIKPNEWMKSFNVSKDCVLEINLKIINRIKELTEAYKEQRSKEGKSVPSARCLQLEPFIKEHTPKKKERKLFFLASTKELRQEFLEKYHAFCEKCRVCYTAWCQQDYSILWPPEAFIPCIPPP